MGLYDLLGRYLARRLNISKIEKRLNITKAHNTATAPRERKIRVSCVQRSISLAGSLEDYIDMLEGFVAKAAQEGSHIVAFPEYNFFNLLGLIPGLRHINNYLNKRIKCVKAPVRSEIAPSKGNQGGMYSFFNACAPPIGGAVEAIMTGLAKKYNIYIYTGSYLLNDGGLYNTGALISREGKLLARQNKLHLTSYEANLGFKGGDCLTVLDLDIGKTAFPICMDATYFETFKIARDQGCDIVIIPISNNEEYNLYRALRGIWPRVQESYVYGLKPSLNGWFMGMHFTGRAGVFAPLELTRRQNGVVAISKDYEGNSLVTADIDLDALEAARQEAEYFGDINRDFERDYYNKTYGEVMK